MIVEGLIVCFLAKLKGYKLKKLFKTWTFYPILLIQILLVICQFSIFFKTDFFFPFVAVTEGSMILSFFFALFIFKLYTPGIIGSMCVGFGTLLNKFVIFQNGGKMPVYPTLSYITGYLTEDKLKSLDNIHILGDSSTKYKILTDYIDYGYSILSLGDVFIHLFFCIMLYALIKKVNEIY